MQNGDRVQFVSCPELPAVTDSATFYYLQNSDKLYLGSQLIANNVKDVQNSETPGKLRITQFDGSTREIDIPGNAFGIDCYKGKFPLDFTSPGGAIDEWKIYGNSSGPTEVLETQSVLPTTITAHSGNAVDWEIYGNNNPVVENKTGDLPIEVSATAGNAVDWTIYGNDDNGTENLFDISKVAGGAITVDGYTFTKGFTSYWYDIFSHTSGYGAALQTDKAIKLSAGTYSLSAIEITPSIPKWNVRYADLNGQNQEDIISSKILPQTFTLANDGYVSFRIDQGTPTVSGLMLVKGSTAPDHYIPYQQGVGERTRNLVFTYLDSASIDSNGSIGGNNVYDLAVAPVTSGETYSVLRNYTVSSSCVYGFFTEQPTYGSTTYNDSRSYNSAVSFSFKAPIDGYVAFWSQKEANRHQSTCVKGSTAPTTYIPYGYQIPLDIRHKTKNLVDITGFDRMLYGVRWYEDNGQLRASGTYTDSAAHTQPRFYAELNAGTYTMSGAPNSELAGAYLQIGTCTDEQGSNFSSLGSDTGTGYTFTLQEGSWVSIRVVTTASLYQQTVDLTLPIMLRLADTSSDFEPYYLTNHEDIYIGNSPLTQGQSITKAQSNVDLELFSGDNIIDTSLYNKPNTSITYNSSVLGVGQRTENEFIGTMEIGGWQGTVGNVPTKYGNNARLRCNAMFSTATTGTYTIAVLPSNFKISVMKCGSDGKVISDTGWSVGNYHTLTNLEQCVFVVKNASGTDISPLDIEGVCIVKGSTPPTSCIPGYKIPLLVTSGQQSTPYTIYIGSAPLTEGQSVTKTSSGTDIALYQGENTISTTLGNKPEMKIDYLSTVVGVGERTKNLIEGIIEKTNINEMGVIVSNTSFNMCVAKIIKGQEYTITTTSSGFVYGLFSAFPTLQSQSYDKNRVIGQRTFTAPIDGYIAFRSAPSDTLVMLNSGSTALPYEPYGYQIPIDIKQDDEVVDHKDIYIGTQPLVEGDYINQTGVYRRLQQLVNYIDSEALPEFDFIPITEQLVARNGENTITTSLVNNNTIDVELHPTTQASWICSKLEDLQRRIDNVDSTLGAPERRNYLVTWCSEARLTHTGALSAPLTTEFANSSEYAESASALTISGTSYATGEFMQTIDLLAMVTNYANRFAGSSNYTVARPGDYAVIIYNTVCSKIAANQSISLQIVQNDDLVITQALTNEYIGCVPFKILNLNAPRTVTQIQIIVESASAWTTLDCRINIAVVNASMVYQDSAALVDTDPRLSSMSLYDTVISANQQFQVSLTDLTARVEALEQGGGGGSSYNETQTDTVTDAVEEVTQ